MRSYTLIILALTSVSSFTPCRAQDNSELTSPTEQTSHDEDPQEEQKKEKSSARAASIIPFLKEHKNILGALGGAAALYFVVGFFLKRSAEKRGSKNTASSVKIGKGKKQASPERIHPPQPSIYEPDRAQPSSKELAPQRPNNDAGALSNRTLFSYAALVYLAAILAFLGL